MNNANLLKIKSLRRDAEVLATIEEKYKKVLENPHADKHGFSFGYPDRSLVTFQATIALNTYVGYYGNSSVSVISSVGDSKAVERALHSWANKNKELILKGIAKELEIEAAGLYDEARAELKAQMEYLNELEDSHKNID